MPLPPAPTKRAARVAKEAFDVPAGTNKRAATAKPPVIELDDEPVAMSSAPIANTPTPKAPRSNKKTTAAPSASAATTAA
ncbi:MAG: hypothetical protein RR584_10800, partial [Comamonas sp.]